MLHAVTGGRRVHLQFIAALNPFRSAQCVPDSYYTRHGGCVHGFALILLYGVGLRTHSTYVLDVNRDRVDLSMSVGAQGTTGTGSMWTLPLL